jgi:L-threonylcarbamoyladenylate synthase
MLTASDARRLERCLAGGDVALFPADTVYGLACDPEQAAAVARLYELKGRAPHRPAAVMFFSLKRALDALPELAPAERRALGALLPGPVTLLLPNPRGRFAAACASDPDTLGLRVPRWDAALAALASVALPAMQSSANLTGEAEPCRLEDVPAAIRAGVGLELDGGERPGVASTVVDLRDWAQGGRFAIARHGALSESEVAGALAGVGPGC